MRVHRLFACLMAFVLLIVHVTGALAQDTVPRADPRVPDSNNEPATGERVDLAAIALASEDLPTGYALSFEAYLSGDDISDYLLGGETSRDEIAAIGLRWYYESQYESADGLNRIRAYVEEYDSASAVEDGFDLLEDEERFSASGMSSVDQPGLDGIGEAPSEVTVITFEATDESASGASIDATFRVGKLLVGVAIDTTSTEPPDEDLLAELAARLEERARAVLGEDDLPGIEPGLALSLLHFGDALVIQEGYVTLLESVAAEAPEAVAETYESGYVRTVVLGMEVDPDLPLPFVTVSASSFASESGALAYLSNAGTLTPAASALERAEIERIPGTGAAVAFSYVNPFDGGSPDSFRIILTVDAVVLSVDVQGAKSLDEARAVALSLVEQQIPCIAEAVVCGTAALPAGFEPSAG